MQQIDCVVVVFIVVIEVLQLVCLLLLVFMLVWKMWKLRLFLFIVSWQWMLNGWCLMLFWNCLQWLLVRCIGIFLLYSVVSVVQKMKMLLFLELQLMVQFGWMLSFFRVKCDGLIMCMFLQVILNGYWVVIMKCKVLFVVLYQLLLLFGFNVVGLIDGVLQCLLKISQFCGGFFSCLVMCLVWNSFCLVRLLCSFGLWVYIGLWLRMVGNSIEFFRLENLLFLQGVLLLIWMK